MNAQANIKLKAFAILEYLLASNNEELVDKVDQFIKDQSQTSTLGYESSGNPITVDNLKASIREAEEDFKAGRTKSHAEIKAKFLNGRKS